MLYFITWVTDFAIFLLIFSVSRLLAEQEVSAVTLGILGALFSSASVLSNTFSGRISDRLGRRKVAACGVVLLLLGLSGVAFLPTNHWTYFASYGLCGFAAGSIYPSIIAWLNHGLRGRAASRAILRFCLSFNLGLIAGQLVGGELFEHFGYRWPLYTAMCLLATSLIVILSIRDEPRVGMTDEKEPTEVIPHDMALSAAFTRVCWVANVAGAFSVSMVFYLLPFVLVDLHIPSDRHGMMLAISRVAVIGTFFVMHSTTFWHHRFSTTLVAQSLGILGLVGLSLAETPWMLTASLCTLSILLGYNYFSGLYYSNIGSAEHRRGAASGLHEATLAVGFSAGPLCGGFVGDWFGNRAPFVLAACSVGALLLVQTIVYLRHVAPLRHQESLSNPAMEDLNPVPVERVV